MFLRHPIFVIGALQVGLTDGSRGEGAQLGPAVPAQGVDDGDDGVGDVLQMLRDLGLETNTLVIFSSDNGPANENGGDPRLFDSWGPLDGFKRDCWEGGIRVPTLACAAPS